MKMLKLMFGLIAFGSLVAAGPSRVLAQSEPPVVTTNPLSQSVAAGTSVTFTVEASGTAPFSYQWFYSGFEISGATDSSFTIASVTTNDSGDYVVSVMNEVNTAISGAATLTVTETPSGPPILDFNNDGNADLLWVHADGRIIGWLMNSTQHIGSVTFPDRAPSGWKVAGQADFDHDGKIDFLWQHANGRVAGWFMDGTNKLGSFSLPRRSTGGWRVVGLSDFNADGSTDLLWQHGNGRVGAWLMDGTNLLESVLLNDGKRAQGGWKVAGLTDLDEDGDKDILWQHGGGRLAVWYLNGVDVDRIANFQFSGKTTSSWHLAGISDLDGDGENDLIWRHSEGYLRYWLMNGTMTPQIVPAKGKRVGPGMDLRSK